MSQETLKVQIIKKAWSDPKFKADLLADPKGAIRSAFGIEVPDDIELIAVEETPNRYYLTIPPNPDEVQGSSSGMYGIWN